jgi:MYXO-CTERM domain-containing protein
LPAYPLDGATGLAGALRLVVANASDPDGDPLTYEFELDEDPTFASPSRVEAVAEGAGYTAAPFDGLAPSATYVWRARASDGEQAGPWAVAGFRTTAADAGLPDAGPAVSSPAPSCRAGHGPPGWLMPAALLGLVLWRRR